MISFYVRYINTETVFSIKKTDFKRHSRIYFPKDILFVTIFTMLVSVVWDFLNQKESQNKKFFCLKWIPKNIYMYMYTLQTVWPDSMQNFFFKYFFFFTIIALKSLLRNIFIFLSPSSFVDWLSVLPFINFYSFWLAEKNI